MRKTSISIVLLALLGAGACTREIAQDSPEQQGDIVLRIALDGLETKTPGEGDENTVRTLDIVIFNNAGTKQLYNWHVADASMSINGDYYVHSTTVGAMSNLGSDKSATLQSAKVFAIANYPGGAISSSVTLAQVKALALSADNTSDSPAAGKFVYEKDLRYYLMSTPSFVMTAEGGFTKDGDKVVSTLTLRRLAAKVSLTVNYAATPIITDGHDATLGVDTKTVWTPLTDEDLRVYLDNAVMEAPLGGLKASPAHFRYADNHPTGDPLASAAFYTYPATWTEGSGDAPFVKIIQPWHYQTVYENASNDPVVIDENVVELYYKVMFPGLTALESNTWYQPTVTLNVLGGEADRPKELIPTGFDVLPWGNASAGISPIEVQPVKYLTVERENTTVTNGNKVQVRYFASSPATLTVNSIIKQTYNNYEMVTKHIYPADGSVADALAGYATVPAGTTDPSWWFSNTYNSSTNEGIITLNHELSTVFINPAFAARPYIYSLTLSLGEPGVSDQNFTITQVPSVLVECYLSTGWVAVNGTTSNFGGIYRARTSSDNAITSVISYTPSNRYVYQRGDKSTSMGYVNTYVYLNPNENNSSRYRAIIQTAPDNTMYVLDPRKDLSTTSYANIPTDDELYDIINTYKDSGNNIHEGTPLTTNSDDIAKILKYRPTINPDRSNTTMYPANDAKEHYGKEIAPEFMVASSYGKGSGTSYSRAVLRCAAYQEDGYPAGRWRLPTEAEIYYCVELSSKGAMPSLFGGKDYWASSGRLFQTDEQRLVENPDSFEKWSQQNYFGSGYTRCVYDTWYWGRGEVEALKDGKYEDTYQKYKWSGWDYITK